MRVCWTHTALEHLVSIHSYISADSIQYARRVIDRITARTVQLGEFPESGEQVREYDDAAIRQVVEGPYRIIYRVLEDRVDILAVIHGARDLRRLGRIDSD